MTARIPLAVCLASLVASAAMLMLPAPAGLEPGVMRGAGAVTLGVGLWATRVIPEHLGSIIFFLVVVLFAVAPPEVVFVGFQSSALWLVFGGLVMGTAAERTGLGDRVAGLTVRYLPTSYLGILTLLALIAFVLGFFIPTGIGRLALLVPIVVGLCAQLGFKPGSRGYVGLVLGTAMATIAPTHGVLTANLPPIVLAGAAESIYGLRLSYLDYLVVNLPVLGIGGLAVVVVACTVLFADAPSASVQPRADTPWTSGQRRLLVVLIAAVLLWSTDGVHGVAPAWVALAAGVVCLLPRSSILLPGDMVKHIDYAPWFFTAGAIGLGAVATDTGLGEFVGHSLIAVLDITPGEHGYNYAMLVVMESAVGLVSTIVASPAILTPLADALAHATGWRLESVLMTQVPCYMFFPFPYQVPPVVLVMFMAGLSLGPVVRFLLLHMVLGFVVVLPLHYQWVQWLGYTQ